MTAQLSVALADVSEQVKREVGALIPAAADEFVSILHARYPRGRKEHPGIPHMQEDAYVRTVQSQDALLPVRKVIGPRLAYIWQDGTKQRTDATRGGANRGRMPAASPGYFQRTAAQVRASMLRLAVDIVNRPRQMGGA